MGQDIERLNALVRELRTENDRLARLAACPQRAQKTFIELVERAPFGIYVVDSQFRIATMNAGSQNGPFRNLRPIIGRSFDEAMHILWPEAVAEEIIGRFRHTLDTGEPFYSSRFVNPRHDVGIVESYEWELHRIVLPDGQHGVICYYFDSTALRQVEHALRQSKTELSFALELNDALRQIDDPLQIQEAAARLLGERLQADRVFYGEIIVEDGVETLVLERDTRAALLLQPPLESWLEEHPEGVVVMADEMGGVLRQRQRRGRPAMLWIRPPVGLGVTSLEGTGSDFYHKAGLTEPRKAISPHTEPDAREAVAEQGPTGAT